MKGTLSFPDGKKITGEIDNMNPVVGKATIAYPDGTKEIYTGNNNYQRRTNTDSPLCAGIKKVITYSQDNYKEIRLGEDKSNYLLPGAVSATFLLSFTTMHKDDLAFQLTGFDGTEEQMRKKEIQIANDIKGCLGASFTMTTSMAGNEVLGHDFTNGRLTISLIYSGTLTFSK